MVAFLTFLPHHDAKITSGSRRATSSGSTMRSLAKPALASSGKRGAPPAISTSSSTQPMPEIIGSSHSSKDPPRRRRDRDADPLNASRSHSPPAAPSPPPRHPPLP